MTNNAFTSNNWSLCGYLYCEVPIGSNRLIIDALERKELCWKTCQNLDKNQYDDIQCQEEIQSGSDKTRYLEDCDAGDHIKICDNVCDCRNCQDESQCNGFMYGKICNTVPRLIIKPPFEICDNTTICISSKYLWTDEEGCDSIPPGRPSCIGGELLRRKDLKKVIPIFNYTRCSAILWSFDRSWYGSEKSNAEKTGAGTPYCWDYIDQTNCTDEAKVAVRCFIAGYGYSTISKVMVCGKFKQGFCVDGMDVACVDVDQACTIHKHQLCDGAKDCSSGADESHPWCLVMTEKTCYRNYRTTRKLRIPAAWLRDNLMDCMDGADEKWEIECGYGLTKRFEVSKVCEDVFLCRYGQTKFVRLPQLCNGVEGIGKCNDENIVCETGRGLSSMSTVVSHQTKNVKSLRYCLKGLEDLEHHISPCITQEFNPFYEEVFGVGWRTKVIHQNQSVDCRFTYGEPYMYLSCLGLCENTECPLTKPVDYRDCPLQYDKRIYTVVNKSRLTFVNRRFDGYHNNYFVCANGLMCIEYDKVCNLWYDCGDGSDEKNCSNNFICEDNQGILPLSKKCDGNVDCGDISDECNSECSKEIINEPFLKGAAWLIGLLAVLCNICILYENISSLEDCYSGQSLANRLLIILIGVGDFLVGAYLFLIALADSFFYGKDYCSHQFQWLTSWYCSSLGIMSTFGSFVSLFSLSILSIMRAIKLYRGGINQRPQRKSISQREYINISVLMFFIVLCSATIASLSLLDMLEDFFVNGLVYDKSIKIFHGQMDKTDHFKVIQSYFGRSKDRMFSWKQIQSLVGSMFSDDYGNLDGKVSRVDFYGNDGVCLFKFFVTPNDPQMVFSMVILAISILCFATVSGAYIAINMMTFKSSKSLVTGGGHTAGVVRKRNQRLQKKIATIIITDFLCWIPFVLVCFLHYFGVLDATAQYGLFSIIILPINSVVNPFLYSEVLSGMMNNVRTKIKIFYGFVCEKINTENHNKKPRSTGNTVDSCENSVVETKELVKIPMAVLGKAKERNAQSLIMTSIEDTELSVQASDSGNTQSLEVKFGEDTESHEVENLSSSQNFNASSTNPTSPSIFGAHITEVENVILIPTIIFTEAAEEKNSRITVDRYDGDEELCDTEDQTVELE